MPPITFTKPTSVTYPLVEYIYNFSLKSCLSNMEDGKPQDNFDWFGAWVAQLQLFQVNLTHLQLQETHLMMPKHLFKQCRPLSGGAARTLDSTPFPLNQPWLQTKLALNITSLVVGATFEKVRADRRLDGIPRVRACGWRNGGAPGQGLQSVI